MSVFLGFGQVIMVYPGLENFSWHKEIVEGREVILVIFNLLDINVVDNVDREVVSSCLKKSVLRLRFV
jgi:hypothetical protein